MRVVGLSIAGFKGIVAADITPDEHAVVIAGENGQGKSSVLDAIWAAIAGRGFKDPDPVHHGAGEAVVSVDLGNLKATRRWVAGKASGALTVTLANGSKLSSPQRVLDELVGELTFDPLMFANTRPADQKQILVDLVGLGEINAELQAQRQEAYDERTVVNRALKGVESRLAALPAPKANIPALTVSVSELATELQSERQKQSRFELLKGKAAELREKIEDLQAELDDVVIEGRKLASRGRQTRIDALVTSIERADVTNEQVRVKRQHTDLVEEKSVLEQQVVTLTQRIEASKSKRDLALQSAGLPIDGLGFTEDGVTYNGVPFEQASAGERLRVSVAIAMALNPKLRVIRVTDASLLDKTNLALLRDLAVAHDYQLWLEVVGDGGPDAITIEEGMVRA